MKWIMVLMVLIISCLSLSILGSDEADTGKSTIIGIASARTITKAGERIFGTGAPTTTGNDGSYIQMGPPMTRILNEPSKDEKEVKYQLNIEIQYNEVTESEAQEIASKAIKDHGKSYSVIIKKVIKTNNVLTYGDGSGVLYGDGQYTLTPN